MKFVFTYLTIQLVLTIGLIVAVNNHELRLAFWLMIFNVSASLAMIWVMTGIDKANKHQAKLNRWHER